MTVFILLLMIFLHIWDDFGRQGIMASMKQKSWWEKQEEYLPMYRYDYIVALLMHSFSWTFMIMLPIFALNHFEITWGLGSCFCINAIIHALTDNSKANFKEINLVFDQTVHLAQIFCIWLIFVA